MSHPVRYALVGTALTAMLAATVWASVPLVAFDQAAGAENQVLLAGVVDQATVSACDDGIVFTVVGPQGARLDVRHSGKLPEGFDVAPVVVLVGRGVDGRFEASEVLLPGSSLLPPAQSPEDSGRGLKAVAAVTMVVWIGLFVYLLGLHRKLRALEAS